MSAPRLGHHGHAERPLARVSVGRHTSLIRHVLRDGVRRISGAAGAARNAAL